jgi:hypothetical protein
MATNLVLGATLGYDVEKIKPFVISFRQHSNDYISFVTANIDQDMQAFCKTHKVNIFTPADPVNRSTIQVQRYQYYRQLIIDQYPDVDAVLLSDVRDVVFQRNPFLEQLKYDLEFFAEPEIFKNCKHNAPWVAGLYGHERVNEIGSEFVICSGTTIGSRAGILQYLDTMITEITRLQSQGRTPQGGEDQPIHNHLVYNNCFTNYRINHNGQGLVATMHHSKTLTFNRQGHLLDDNGLTVPIVHQYDRCGPMSLVFLKNALGLTGKNGIGESAIYAINNFYEHDLG